MKYCPVCESLDTRHERHLNNIELLRCRSCSLVYADMNDAVVLEENDKFSTQRGSKSFENRLGFLDSKWFDAISRKLSRRIGPGTVLDIGCSIGILLSKFKERGCKIYGADLSDYAKEYGDKYGYEVYIGKIESAPIPEDTFDLITNTNVLEHVAQPVPYMKKILRLLKPGGLAYFNVPNYGSLSIRLGVSAFFRNHPPQHTNYFTRKSIIKMLELPELGKDIYNVSVRAYGIPESHRIVNVIKKKIRNTVNNKQSSPGKLKRQVGGVESPLRKILSEMMIQIYYHSGRLFFLGDKLEIIIQKKFD